MHTYILTCTPAQALLQPSRPGQGSHTKRPDPSLANSSEDHLLVGLHKVTATPTRLFIGSSHVTRWEDGNFPGSARLACSAGEASAKDLGQKQLPLSGSLPHHYPGYLKGNRI